jgi:hypothetical protein
VHQKVIHFLSLINLTKVKRVDISWDLENSIGNHKQVLLILAKSKSLESLWVGNTIMFNSNFILKLTKTVLNRLVELRVYSFIVTFTIPAYIHLAKNCTKLKMLHILSKSGHAVPECIVDIVLQNPNLIKAKLISAIERTDESLPFEHSSTINKSAHNNKLMMQIKASGSDDKSGMCYFGVFLVPLLCERKKSTTLCK